MHGLVAPESYFNSKNHTKDKQDCYFTLYYEDIMNYFKNANPQNDNEKRRFFYRHHIIKQAITKSRRGWEPIHDSNTANFQLSLYNHIKQFYTIITMKKPKETGIPRESKFIKLYSQELDELNDLPNRVLRLKFRESKETGKFRVDIEFKGMGKYFNELQPLIEPLLDDEMICVMTNKSISISMIIPTINQRIDFEVQKNDINIMLTNTCHLVNWVCENHLKLIDIFQLKQ